MHSPALLQLLQFASREVGQHFVPFSVLPHHPRLQLLRVLRSPRLYELQERLHTEGDEVLLGLAGRELLGLRKFAHCLQRLCLQLPPQDLRSGCWEVLPCKSGHSLHGG